MMITPPEGYCLEDDGSTYSLFSDNTASELVYRIKLTAALEREGVTVEVWRTYQSEHQNSASGFVRTFSAELLRKHSIVIPASPGAEVSRFWLIMTVWAIFHGYRVTLPDGSYVPHYNDLPELWHTYREAPKGLGLVIERDRNDASKAHS
ncbi:TPA: hypothetical protein ACIAHZ_004019 [Enterobacter roggenkampii]|uniref:hypothetical protein n=1 Tax=Enterobacter roggenkampii TaxID=1812935 RepID=UPI003785CB5E